VKANFKPQFPSLISVGMEESVTKFRGNKSVVILYKDHTNSAPKYI